MFKKIKNIKINYKQYGQGRDIVLLHGWGQNIDMMRPLGDKFMDNYRITIIDLPGFGVSEEPKEAYTIFDYVEIVHELLINLQVNNPIMMVHSFGGRIAICYAAKYETTKVVLLSSPFRPSKKKNSLKTRIYKLVKKIGILKPLTETLKKKWGSADYLNASDTNRGTLVKVVNEDLTNYAKSIKCPVLLIYGQKDSDVPISEGQELEKIIPDAGLVSYEEAHHYAYLEKLSQTLAILNNFFE